MVVIKIFRSSARIASTSVVGLGELLVRLTAAPSLEDRVALWVAPFLHFGLGHIIAAMGLVFGLRRSLRLQPFAEVCGQLLCGKRILTAAKIHESRDARSERRESGRVLLLCEFRRFDVLRCLHTTERAPLERLFVSCPRVGIHSHGACRTRSARKRRKKRQKSARGKKKKKGFLKRKVRPSRARSGRHAGTGRRRKTRQVARQTTRSRKAHEATSLLSFSSNRFANVLECIGQEQNGTVQRREGC